MKAKLRQDRNGVRTPVDVDRRYNRVPREMSEVKEIVEQYEVDDRLSTSSTNPVQNRIITNALNSKVTKEAGKGLSTNDFTNEYKEQIDNNTTDKHTHDNKNILDNITQNDINNWNKGGKEVYDLSAYKVSALTILRSSCVKKDNRVCINFVGTLSMSANATTTLFNLPYALMPQETKDFVVFGQSTNNDGYIGYGYVTSAGLMQVRFNQAISSYIRFSVVYDMD